jgi:hypothetical protein
MSRHQLQRRYGRTSGGLCYIEFRHAGPDAPWTPLGRWGIRSRPGDAPRFMSRIEAGELIARLRRYHPNIAVRIQ